MVTVSPTTGLEDDKSALDSGGLNERSEPKLWKPSQGWTEGSLVRWDMKWPYDLIPRLDHVLYSGDVLLPREMPKMDGSSRV